jgi:hypothetical protein
VNETGHEPSELVQLGLVVNHFCTGLAGNGVVFAEVNGLFRADLLAQTAVDAAGHVDEKFLGRLLHLGKLAV